MDPTDHKSIAFCNKNGAVPTFLQLADSGFHFFQSRWISQLTGKLRKPLGIDACGAPNPEPCPFARLCHGSSYLAPQSFLHGLASQLAQSIRGNPSRRA
jgi:hypothetical protein